MNRFLDVFHLLRSRIYKTQVELAAHLFVKFSGNADASRFRQRFQPCCHVHPVTIKVVAFNDHVADVETDSELHLVFRVYLVVAVPQILLELYRRYNCVHRTAKLRDYGITGATEDTSVIGFNGLVCDSTAGLEVAQCAILIFSHFFAETHHICSEDSNEFSSGCRLAH